MKLPKLFSSVTVFDRVRFLDKLLFTRHLALMLRSGITLFEGVTVLEEQTKSPAFRRVLVKIAVGIGNGQTLAATLGEQPQVFDRLYRSIVAVGEASGNLETNLEYLGATMKKSYEFRRKIQSAMIYPVIVLMAAVGSGLVMVFYILPKLVDLFTSLDVPLPLSTKILLWVGTFFRNWGVVVFPVGVLAVVGFLFLIKKPAVKPKWDRFVLSLPVFGQFFQEMQVASFCRNLGVMLKSGVPITTALATTAEAADNQVYRGYLLRMLKSVENGKSLAKELTPQGYPLIPLIVVKILGVGEKTGKLDESLLYLADFFDSEIDDTTKNLATILEPMLLVGLAIMVGFVALSVITPIYELTGGLHR